MVRESCFEKSCQDIISSVSIELDNGAQYNVVKGRRRVAKSLASSCDRSRHEVIAQGSQKLNLTRLGIDNSDGKVR